MMEKRNFVTSKRTPMDGASDIDDILDAGMARFGKPKAFSAMSSLEKRASLADEASESPDGVM